MYQAECGSQNVPWLKEEGAAQPEAPGARANLEPTLESPGRTDALRAAHRICPLIEERLLSLPKE